MRYPVWPHTFVSPSADSRGAVVSYWRKYVHEVLVNRLGGLSKPRKSVVRLTEVYRFLYIYMIPYYTGEGSDTCIRCKCLTDKSAV